MSKGRSLLLLLALIPLAPARAGDGVEEPRHLAAHAPVAERHGAALALRLHGPQEPARLVLTDRDSCGDLPCPPDERRRFAFDHYDAEGRRHYLRMYEPDGSVRWLRVGPMCDDIATAASPTGFRDPPPHERPDCPPASPPPREQWRARSDALIASERPALAAAEGRAVREGERLVLRLLDGRRVELTQQWLCGDFRCPRFLEQSYRFVSHLAAAGQFLVERRGHTLGEWLLVDERSGAMVIARGFPEPAPDGRHLASVQGDILHNLFRIDLWEVTAAGLVPVFQAEPRPGEGVGFVAWEGPGRIRLHTFESLPQGGYAPAFLERQAGRWRLLRGADAVTAARGRP